MMTPEQLWLAMALIEDQQTIDGPGVEVALRDILNPESYASIEGRFAPDQRCSECGQEIGTEGEPQHMFSVGPEGPTSYFICGGCAQRWKTEALLPNILAKLTGEEL